MDFNYGVCQTIRFCFSFSFFLFLAWGLGGVVDRGGSARHVVGFVAERASYYLTPPSTALLMVVWFEDGCMKS